jgi:alcohol dehydrogenase
MDEEALVMLSDILPTGFECGVLKGQVKPGDSVAIVGAGPIGLAALLTAQFFAPGELIVIDLDDNRLAVARTFGATHVISNSDGQAARQVMALTHGRGVDVAMEAIGLPAGFDICQSIVTAGGQIADLGVHSRPVQLNLDHLWSHNITLTTGLADTNSMAMLMKTYLAGKFDPQCLITHHFQLAQTLAAYDTFGHAKRDHALKVIISVPPQDRGAGHPASVADPSHAAARPSVIGSG